MIKSIYKKDDFLDRFSQGDIITGIDFFTGEKSDTTRAERFNFPYSIVLSQECDLSEDHNSRIIIETGESNHDKKLLFILLCPAFLLESFCQGNHLDSQQRACFNVKMKNKLIKNDEYKRYHYLKKNDNCPNLPDLIIDFKLFFTVPSDLMYKKYINNRIGSLNQLFREHLSQRFTNYLGRIGLPEIDN